MNRCTAAMSSITFCMKAQRLLAESGKRSFIVKLDPSVSKRGCAYGIEFDCQEKQEIRAILSRSNIRVTQYIDSGGGVPV